MSLKLGRQNGTINMKTRKIAFAFTLIALGLGASETHTHRELIIPKSDGMRESIVKTEKDDSAVAKKTAVVSLLVKGQKTNAQVQLTALIHEVKMLYKGKEWTPPSYFELQIQSKTPGIFEWSSWQRDPPRHFQVFTAESENSYACAIVRGIQIWRLTTNRPSELMREISAKMESHPDALIPLDRVTIREAAVIPHLEDVEAIEVKNVSDKSGNLQVTLRGTLPIPEATFELRDGKWVFIKP